MKNNKQTWYSINAKHKEKYADIYLYDEIGSYGVTAIDFVNEIKQLDGKDIYLHINSVGGEIFDGMAIYNTLKKYQGKVTAYIEGIAASMGSVIPLAADEVIMSENSLLMIHNAWGKTMGEAGDMRKTAELLDKLSDEIANVYEKKTGLNLATIKSMMDEETWFNAEEALEYGFIDRVSDAIKVAASFDISKFKNKTEEEIINQLNNQKSKTMTEDLKSWFSAKVDEIVNSVKGTTTEETVETEINVNLIDNEEISNKLSSFENKITELEALLSEKDSVISDLNDSVSNLTTENEELNTLVNKADAKGTKVETEKDPLIVEEKVSVDPNASFYSAMANRMKLKFNN